MTREEFKSRLNGLVQQEQAQGEGFPLDLRISRHPHRVNEDYGIYGLCDAEMDRAYDFVKDAHDWFVDIYENAEDEAYWTGSTLGRYDDEKTAEDKFVSRLVQYGLLDEWRVMGEQGRIGVETEQGIIIFVHEDSRDRYTEFHYPPMAVMQADEGFRLRVLAEYYGEVEDKDALVYWVISPGDSPCPIAPVNAYFHWDGVGKDFED